MKDSLDDVCDRFQEKIGLLDEVIKELKYEIGRISLEDYEIRSEPIKREPLPPYKERLHPRKHWQRKPYWLRTRSNPQRRGYH